MPTTEQISKNNKLQNKLAKEYLKKYPNAILGKINWHSHYDYRTKKLKHAILLKNFSYDFAIPKRDEELFNMLKRWKIKEPPFQEKLINRIFDRIENSGGIVFYWI